VTKNEHLANQRRIRLKILWMVTRGSLVVPRERGANV